jgi:archaellum component FlaF (FlaF/FlaG flagellin family)
VINLIKIIHIISFNYLLISTAIHIDVMLASSYFSMHSYQIDVNLTYLGQTKLLEGQLLVRLA